MPNYAWRGRHPDFKNTAGETMRGASKGLRTIDPSGPTKGEDVKVATATAPSAGRIRCTVSGCGKSFKIAAPLAAHFNRDHKKLRKDKNSWRKYAETD